MAGVTRDELLRKSATSKRLSWHDLRGTHATWCAVRGDEPLRIQQRLGHKHFSTTQGYIVEADSVRAGFGEPFQELPVSTRGATATIEYRSQFRSTSTQARGIKASPAGFENADPSKTPENHCDPVAVPPPEARPTPATARAAHDSANDSPTVADPVEAALAKALEGATAAGRFDVVAQLARELEARRLARAGNVVALDAERKRTR